MNSFYQQNQDATTNTDATMNSFYQQNQDATTNTEATMKIFLCFYYGKFD